MRPARQLPDAGAAAFWKSRFPGHRVLVWYDDDNVWHERLLLWPYGDAGLRGWLIETPDGDVYDEELREGDSITRLRGVHDDGRRGRVEEAVYASLAEIAVEALRRRFREARARVERELAAEEAQPPRLPAKFCD